MSQPSSNAHLQAKKKASNLYGTETFAKPNEVDTNLALKNQNQQINSNLQRVVSEDKFVRKSPLSPDKRPKLRDYIFIAKSSLQKNNEMINQLKSSVKDKGTIAQSLQKMKKKKYSLPNKEIHVIIKRQLQKEMDDTIKSMQEDLQFVKNLNLQDVSNEDLAYLHEVRGVLMYKVAPALNEIKQFGLKRQNPLLRQIIALGNNLNKTKEIKIQEQQQQAPQKNKNQPSGKEKGIPSPKMNKPPSIASSNLFETLIHIKSPQN